MLRVAFVCVLVVVGITALTGAVANAGHLAEPPRYRRVSKSAPAPIDRMGKLLEDWMRELTIGNTLDGE